jgi:ribose transport system ATP-binding protein
MTRIAVEQIEKSFGAPVLRKVSLRVEPGKILGLVGENGAGKSTLANIIIGAIQPDHGRMMIDDANHQPRSPRDAQSAGVALASQELSLFDTLNVAENLLVGALPKTGWLTDRAVAENVACAALDEVALYDVMATAPMAGLSVATRQLIEFAKSLATGAKLVILDEPTSALTGPQADRLHAVMAERARGGTSFIYVSHRLTDVLAVCDDIAVLRDGIVVLSSPASTLTVNALIEAMSGRPAHSNLSNARPAKGDVALSVTNMTNADFLTPINLDLCRGEIVGIAGLAGAGRTELLEAIFGLKPLTGGRVCKLQNGQYIPINSPANAVSASIGMVSEDRRRSGIFAGQGIAFNASVSNLWSLAKRGFVNRDAEQRTVDEQVGKLGIRSAGTVTIERLSGGNQQKVLLARWLIRDVDILLLDEPTRGVDVGAKADIHREVTDLAKSGRAVIIVSSDLEELVEVCDRILVLSSHQIVKEFNHRPFDTVSILSAAFDAHIGARGDPNHAAEGVGT